MLKEFYFRIYALGYFLNRNKNSAPSLLIQRTRSDGMEAEYGGLKMINSTFITLIALVFEATKAVLRFYEIKVSSAAVIVGMLLFGALYKMNKYVLIERDCGAPYIEKLDALEVSARRDVFIKTGVLLAVIFAVCVSGIVFSGEHIRIRVPILM